MNAENKQRRKMKSEEIEQIRESLLERKKLLWNQILYDLDTQARSQHQELVDSLRESGDQAIEDLRESNAIQFVEFKVKELEQIEEAMRLMDSGEYGTCQDCGRSIRPARMKVQPFAIRCIKCQEKKERIDNI